MVVNSISLAHKIQLGYFTITVFNVVSVVVFTQLRYLHDKSTITCSSVSDVTFCASISHSYSYAHRQSNSFFLFSQINTSTQRRSHHLVIAISSVCQLDASISKNNVVFLVNSSTAQLASIVKRSKRLRFYHCSLIVFGITPYISDCFIVMFLSDKASLKLNTIRVCVQLQFVF